MSIPNVVATMNKLYHPATAETLLPALSLRGHRKLIHVIIARASSVVVRTFAYDAGEAVACSARSPGLQFVGRRVDES